MRWPSRRGPGHGSILAALVALMNSWLNLRLACSGVSDPSGDCHAKSRSMNSEYEPGLVYLNERVRLVEFSVYLVYYNGVSVLLEALTNKTRPILDCVSHEAAVDVIELFMICPLGFHIVNLETDVRGYPITFLDADIQSLRF